MKPSDMFPAVEAQEKATKGPWKLDRTLRPTIGGQKHNEAETRLDPALAALEE